MFTDTFGFNINNLTGLNNYDDDFDFCGLDWNVAGPSEPYTGLDGYPNLTPFDAPIPLDPTYEDSLNAESSSTLYQGFVELPFSFGQATIPPFPAHSLLPTLPSGASSLPPETDTVLYNQYNQAEGTPNPDWFDFDFSTATASSSLPVVHSSLPEVPSYEELWGQHPPPDPLRFAAPPVLPATGVTALEIDHPAPVASSSGLQRGQPTRVSRRHNPTRPAEKANSETGSWDQTLVRFQSQLDALVLNGQPSGGLIPKTALAEINKIAKEDLKRSPLRAMKAGEGERSRDVGEYLKGLLKALRPVKPTLIFFENGAELIEEDTTLAMFSRLADELEDRLVAVNQLPALRLPTNGPRDQQEVGREQTRRGAGRSAWDKGRRLEERRRLERISRLFKTDARRKWSRKNLLGLAVLLFLYGNDFFPHDFIEVRPTASGS